MSEEALISSHGIVLFNVAHAYIYPHSYHKISGKPPCIQKTGYSISDHSLQAYIHIPITKSIKTSGLRLE